MSWLDDVGDAARRSFAGDELLRAGVPVGAAVANDVAWWTLGLFGVEDPRRGDAAGAAGAAPTGSAADADQPPR